MSDASKCDVCGALYDCPYTPDIKVTVYYHPYGNLEKDLCANCYAKLEEFFKIPLRQRNVRNGKWIVPE